ncbi:MAG: prolipoprotein diacylglyceryl transferase [Erysipelotrichaceae bacterium]|nr:prolipoprotein diacylglyceryl transferase [Erysipelotrichaceae bacterium]MBR5048256.1 prolipoprotein diacylglyceryl transferase [Erysipelotrichaceae bacterium]
MTFFPSREIFLRIGEGIEIRWYAVCILTGAVLAYLGAQRQGKKAGYDGEIFDDIFIGALAFGILGARLWYCLFYDAKGYFSNPISIFEIWDGGLAIHGGVFAGLLFVLVYCKAKNFSFWHLADIVLPWVLIGQCLGRWGNFANQECFGEIVDESFYNGILSFLKEGMYINGAYREPMFFFESTLCLIGFILIQIYRRTSKTTRGCGVFAYMAWYGAIRFWIESRRTDSLMIGSLKVAQLISAAFMIIGIAGLLGLFSKLIDRDKPVVIFDLDGTLLDTRPAIEASFLHVFKEYLPDREFTDEEKADFMGPTLQQTFRKYLPDEDVEALVEKYRVHNRQMQKTLVKAFPHAREMLDYLKDNGYRYGIASSKTTEIIRLGLQAAGLDDYFSVIVGVEEIENPKPDKEVIVKGYQRLHGRLDNAVYVGDVVSDVKAAQNAGVYSIAYCSNPIRQQALEDARPNKLIHDLGEIIDILREDHRWTSNLM